MSHCQRLHVATSLENVITNPHVSASVCLPVCRFGGSEDQSKNKEDTQKEEPNFELSGKLTAETNTYKVTYT